MLGSVPVVGGFVDFVEDIKMFNYIQCEKTVSDVVLTLVVLYTLYTIDMILTYINLKNLKKLYPKKYMKFEINLAIKFLVSKLGLDKGMLLYLPIGYAVFTFVFVYLMLPSVMVGVFVTIVFLIHLPNFFEIRKRLKKQKSL